MPVKKEKKLYFWKEKPTNKAESTPKMAEIKKKKDKTRLARFTPGELTRIEGDIRGSVKTAAVPSGPALIARGARGLGAPNARP